MVTCISFLEFQFNRTIAKQIVDDLCDRGYDAELLVPEDDDIPLQDRCKRVNDIVAREGKQNVILISSHANAFGNGYEWTKASGWAIYTSKGNTAADELATAIAEAAKTNLPAMKMRADFSYGDIDFEEDFKILRGTLCACVLSENGFMTNEKECRWLQTEEALSALVKTHVEGIVNYLATI